MSNESNPLTKATSLWDLFKAGQMVANPVAWKTGQITAAYIVAFLSAGVATARAFGYDLPVTDEQLGVIASIILGAFGLFNHIATTVSTTKMGFLPGSKAVEPISVATQGVNSASSGAQSTGSGAAMQEPVRNEPGG
jgi:hypothetical protein